MKSKFLRWFRRSREVESKNCGGSCACAAAKLPEVDKPINRRSALKRLAFGFGAAATSAGCGEIVKHKFGEKAGLSWEEFFKKNYRVMSRSERKATIKRLERLADLRRGEKVNISDAEPLPGVLFGYAFNISKCQGYMDCVDACVKENNQDRESNIQYITMFEQKKGESGFHSANGRFFHEVPVEGNYYFGAQCYHCENPPCVDVCPVGATWKEQDGIVVIDYDWCIGCRYCEAACPYWARRFNWSTPEVPAAEYNPNQHYLGNRSRSKGVMEKCTFCVQRTRAGKQPACVEACPTGARVFGNLLDPNSEIRWILANKKVFRMKEDLGTEPKFWYYMD